MKQQKIHCVILDKDAAVTASLDVALRSISALLEVEPLNSVQQLMPVLAEKKPHLLFCPLPQKGDPRVLLEVIQRHSPDTLLVLISRHEWQGLTTWLLGVESCILPMSDATYLANYIDFLLHYSLVKQDFRRSKHLLNVAELRCHWLVDSSWEPIAYLSRGMHLYANHAYLAVFGFESLAEVRSMPVAQLVQDNERKVFEALSHTVDYNNKPSNRLLTTLRTLDGKQVRAEVRFIPAVLKEQRCVQLHVHPLETTVNVTSKKAVDPWQTGEHPAQQVPVHNGDFSVVLNADDPPIVTNPIATPLATPHDTSAVNSEASAPSFAKSIGFKAPHLPRMRMGFGKSMKLASTMPSLLFAEPCFRQQDGRVSEYHTLVQHLKNDEGRFRLDYWNVGQVISKLSSQTTKQPNYLIFVSMGQAIFNNKTYLKLLLELLHAHAQVAPQIIIALRYEDCIAHAALLDKMMPLLGKVGVKIAVDEFPDAPDAMKLIERLKPQWVRLTPSLVTRIQLDADVLARLQRLTRQLSDLQVQVVANGVTDMSSLNLLCATAAAYLQGSMFQK